MFVFVKMHPKESNLDNTLSEETVLEETSQEAVDWMKVRWGRVWNQNGWHYSCIGKESNNDK